MATERWLQGGRSKWVY